MGCSLREGSFLESPTLSRVVMVMINQTHRQRGDTIFTPRQQPARAAASGHPDTGPFVFIFHCSRSDPQRPVPGAQAPCLPVGSQARVEDKGRKLSEAPRPAWPCVCLGCTPLLRMQWLRSGGQQTVGCPSIWLVAGPAVGLRVSWAPGAP